MAIDSLSSTSGVSDVQNRLARGLERTASGERVNSAADDAAGLAISEASTTQISGFRQAARNLSDGLSIAQVTSGGIENIRNDLQRIRELAVESANGSLNDSDRESNQLEVEQLRDSINEQLANTSFNGRNLLTQSETIRFQAGPEPDQRIDFSTNNLQQVFAEQNFGEISVAAQPLASATIEDVDGLLAQIDREDTRLGALVARFETNLQATSTATISETATRSRITDSDIAEEVAELVQSQIRDQANIAVQSQSQNQRAELVIQLLS